VALSTKSIFDPLRNRTDPTPRRHDEPTFDFYDRCSNEVIGSIRDLLEGWFSHYPKGRHQRDLVGRLRDGDGRQWNSGAWELYVHETLRLFGYTMTPHPRLTTTNRRIDFLAVRGPERVLVECVTVGHSDEASVRRGGIGALEAAIDRSGMLDYWLDLQFDRVGPAPIPPEPFVEDLRSWIAAQDIDALNGISHRGGLPSFDWDHDEWLVHVWAIPRSPELRGSEDIRPLGIIAGDDDDKSVWLALRAAMESKAEAYGELDAPYVVAVNAPDAWPDHEEVELAVFGDLPFTRHWRRDGFLMRADGTSHSGLSGVLLGTGIQPQTFSRYWPTLYENPAASRPLPDSLQWRRVRIVRDGPTTVEGVKPPALFGIAQDWPGRPWPK